MKASFILFPFMLFCSIVCITHEEISYFATIIVATGTGMWGIDFFKDVKALLKPKYITERTVNENGWRVYRSTLFSNKQVGTIYMTFHPYIPYEVYTLNGKSCKRVNTFEEAFEFLESKR